jgi:hypothetical protein
MNGFSFWNSWAKPYKFLWIVLLVLFAGSIICFIGSMLAGNSLVIDWQNVTTLEAIQLPVSSWEHPLASLSIEADSYVAKQNFLGGELQVNLWPAYVLLVLVCLGLSVALAAVSGLKRFWYIAGMALFCGLVVSLRLEQLQLFGRIDKTADVLMFFLFLPFSYYFHSIKPGINLIRRAITFIALFILVGGIFHAFAEVGLPFLYIANYGLPAFIGLSLLVIVLVSPEIIAGIVYLVTASNNEHSQHSLTHFVLASLIYFANLLLYYLEVRNEIDWDIYTISPFYILLISLLAAIWTLRKRTESFLNVISYEPGGALLYISLAIICLSTLSYVFVTANDPFIETFEDAILYTHLGFGGFFFLYIVANFIAPLKQNKRVFDVLYSPRFMPLFTARLTGVIAVLGFYSLHGMWAVFQPVGGYFNAIGDLYSAERNFYLAEQYYKLGGQYKYANHRSNYALASLAVRADKPVQAMLFLKEAVERQPSSFAYANLANLYFNNNLFFDGLFTLREAIKKYPEEGRLYNNLGIQYGKTTLADSALYYLKMAGKDADAEAAAAANELAVLAAKRIPVLADSLGNEQAGRDMFYQTNLLALYQVAGMQDRAPEAANPAALQELGGLEAAYLLNYALLKRAPDTLLSRQLQQLLDSTAVSLYREPASLALAVLYYKQENHFEAFRQLADLSTRSTFNSGRYYELQANWSLEQNAPRLAANYLNLAASLRRPKAAIFAALAMAESGKPLEASESLLNMPDSLLDKQQQQLKNRSLLFLNQQDFSEFSGNRNQAAYLALRMQWARLSAPEEVQLLSQISDAGWRARALGWLAKVKLQQNKLSEAASYLEQLEQAVEQKGNSEIRREYLQLLHQLQVMRGELVVPEEGLFPGQAGALYRQAMQRINQEDTLGSIQYFERIFSTSPFFELAYAVGIPLLNEQGMPDKAYDFLLKGIYFNPYSVQPKKQYILQSLKIGLDEYAEDELLSLMELLNKEEYEAFVQEYEAARTRQQETDFSW